MSTQFLTAAISTTLVLVLLGTIVLFVLTAQNLSTYVKENINVSVLISDEMDSLQVVSMENVLKEAPYAKSVEYVSKEQALQEEIQAQGIDPTEFIGMNPYTASFEIKINAEHAHPDSVSAAVKQLKGNPNVVDVIYSKDLIKSVNDNIRNCCTVHLHILCPHQQHGTSDHFLQAFHHQHDEVGGSQLELYPQTFPRPELHLGHRFGNPC